MDVLQSLTHKPVLNSVLELDRADIVSQLKAIGAQIDKPMIPASISYMNRHFEKTSGQNGQALNIDATFNKITNDHINKQVDAVVQEIPVQPAPIEIDKIRDVLGDYTTYFSPQDASRTQNVRLAANAINNYLIAPGKVFSYNKVVGERTETAGYLPAYIFVGQEEIKGDGGGVCQDSSTLFQAVREANLKVLERHNHSLPVSYVAKGQDATVAYGLLDFRFQNDTKDYLLVSALTGNNWLRIRLFGVADPNHPVQQADGYPVRPDVFNEDFK
ncbi:VanW family protein [Desulfosporosinus sp. SYSU MS00001]|uniref:VanW family protein n=1 Tax=Desulfosporosinus sp. SYSU MS00001 TaxID=3416284 RepID=UPI003CED509B